MRFLRYLFLSFIVVATLSTSLSLADDDSLSIIPKVDDITVVENAIKAVGSKAGNVIDNYNIQASKLECEEQIASGIRDW
jgi:hypothetical protein